MYKFFFIIFFFPLFVNAVNTYVSSYEEVLDTLNVADEFFLNSKFQTAKWYYQFTNARYEFFKQKDPYLEFRTKIGICLCESIDTNSDVESFDKRLRSIYDEIKYQPTLVADILPSAVVEVVKAANATK